MSKWLILSKNSLQIVIKKALYTRMFVLEVELDFITEPPTRRRETP